MVKKTVTSNYNSIDLAKFIFSILVIMIHIRPFGNSSNAYIINYILRQCLARIAVPFYFVASGFFLFKKMDLKTCDWKIAKNYCFRLFKLYIIWTFIYSYFIINRINNMQISNKVLYFFKVWLFSGFDHLWYINATIFAVAFVAFLLYKNVSIKRIVIIGIVLYFIGLLDQSYYGLLIPLDNNGNIIEILNCYNDIFITTRNGLFEGVLFIAMGAYFSNCTIEKKKLHIWGIIGSISLLFLETFMVRVLNLKKDGDMYIFLIPAVYFIFAFIVSSDIKASINYVFIRKISSIVYFSHLLIYQIVNFFICTYFSVLKDTALVFLLTVVFCIGFSCLIIKLSEKKYFGWLKIIY